MSCRNKFNRKVILFWNTYKGKLKKYKELNIGQTYSQNTFLTHPWTFVDNKNNCLITYLPNSEDKTKTLRLSQLKENKKNHQFILNGEFLKGKPWNVNILNKDGDIIGSYVDGEQQ